MLTVTNTFGSRQVITQKDVLKVAKGAQESVLMDTEDHSLDTGVRDQISDSVFFGGRKTTTLSQIHRYSRHTAALSLEFEKPLEKRDQVLIKTHVDAIFESQQKLGQLHPGQLLEFGTGQGRPIVGRESYLIHRSDSRVNPVGIVLYKQGEKNEDIPSFRSVNEIGFDDIRAIRISGRLRCEGQKYKVHFDGINRPIVIGKNSDEDWEMIQAKLSCLFYKHEDQFALPCLNPCEEMNPLLLTVPSKTDSDSIGRPSETGQTIQIEIDHDNLLRFEEVNEVLLSTTSTTDTEQILPDSEAGHTMQANMVSIGAPTFHRCDQIQDCHFSEIRTSEKLRFGKQIFPVKFAKDDEPILLCDSILWNSDESDVQEIQKRLTSLWIVRQAKAAIIEANSIRSADATLPLTSILLEIEGGQIESGIDQEPLPWKSFGDVVSLGFRKAVAIFQKELLAEKAKLIQSFISLTAASVQSSQQSLLLKNGRDQMHRIAVMQENINSNVDTIRNIFLHLFTLATGSIGSDMQSKIYTRIECFMAHLQTFSKSSMRGKHLQTFTKLLSNQVEFSKNFNASQILHCDVLCQAVEISLGLGVRERAPKVTMQETLEELIQDPAAPWGEIDRVMKILQHGQEDPSITIAKQIEIGLELGKQLEFIKVRFARGAEPVSGSSIYTQETYSHIVTCKSLCEQLLNKEVCLFAEDVATIKAEFNQHLALVLKETETLNRKEKGFLFLRHKLYRPMRNGSGSLMNFAQYCRQKTHSERTF